MKTWNKPEIEEIEVSMTMGDTKKTPDKYESTLGTGYFAAS